MWVGPGGLHKAVRPMCKLKSILVSSRRKCLIVSLIVIATLSGGHALLSVLSSSEVEGLTTTGMQAAFPVRVELIGLSETVAAQSAVTRVSPRGNESTMQQHLFSQTGAVWYSRSNYFGTIRIYVPDEGHREITGVTIRRGTTVHSVAAPSEESSRWRVVPHGETDLPTSLSSIWTNDLTVYGYVPSPSEAPGTIVPHFDGIFNYIGDIRLAAWSLLWAILVWVPIALANPRMLGKRATSRALLVRSLGLLLCVTAFGATVARFLNVSPMPLRFVDPAGLVSSALSMSFVVILFGSIVCHHQPAELRANRSNRPRNDVLALVLITAVGFVLRTMDLDSLMRVDMYNLSAALSLHDTGTFSYTRNTDLTKTLSFLFQQFGRSVQVGKIPFLMAGTLTIPLIYALASFISRRIALFSAAIFALAPNHIAMAGHVREYSINLALGTLFLISLFVTYRRLSSHKFFFPLALIGVLGTGFALTHLYSAVANNGTVLSVAQAAAFASLALVLHYISQHFRAFLAPAMLIAVVLFAIGFSFVHVFGPFSRGLLVQSSFVRAYLNPLSLDSMQTFSMAAVSTVSIGGLLLAPSIISNRSPYVDAASVAFWGTLVVYSLKLDAGGADRYLYHVAGLHSLLLAAGLLIAFTQFQPHLTTSRIARIGGLLLLLTLVNPVNSTQAAFNIVPSYTDLRRPTGLSGGGYYRQLAQRMREFGADDESSIIEAGAPPYLASIVFNRPFTRRWYAEGGTPHEIGEGIYPVKWRHGADHSLDAFRHNAKGLLLTDEYTLFPVGHSFRLGDIEFSYKAILPHPHDPFEAFTLYGWSVTGPDLRALGRLSENPRNLPETRDKSADSVQND